MGEIVGDEHTPGFQCSGCDKKVGIREQGALAMQHSVECGRPVDHSVREGQDDAGLTEEPKGRLLRRGALCLQAAHKFIACDD